MRKELSGRTDSESVRTMDGLESSTNGVEVRGKLASYAIGVIGDEKPRLGGELGADGAAWAKIATALPPSSPSSPARRPPSISRFPPAKKRSCGSCWPGRAPTWNGVGYNWATKVPERLHRLAADVHAHVRQVLPQPRRDRPAASPGSTISLLRRILAWQQAVYTDESLPVWLRESLVNILHLITEDSLWAQAKPPVPDWVKEKDGLFGMIECPRECPKIECIPCSFYGNVPLVYFFPEAALSTLRGYKGYQEADGAVPFMFGGCCIRNAVHRFAMPSRGYQITMNGPCYVDLVDRYLMCHGTKELADEFYPSVKKAMAFTMDLNRGPDGVVSMPDPQGQRERADLGDGVVRVDPLGRHRAARRRHPPGHGPHGRADGRADRRPAVRRPVPPVDRRRPEDRSTTRCGPASTT